MLISVQVRKKRECPHISTKVLKKFKCPHISAKVRKKRECPHISAKVRKKHECPHISAKVRKKRECPCILHICSWQLWMRVHRTEDCTLETIGKPVFKRYTPDQHGGWVMDPAPRDPEDYHKVRDCGVEKFFIFYFFYICAEWKYLYLQYKEQFFFSPNFNVLKTRCVWQNNHTLKLTGLNCSDLDHWWWEEPAGEESSTGVP